MHGARHGVISTKPPIEFPVYGLEAIVLRVALMDAGLSWLLGRLQLAAR